MALKSMQNQQKQLREFIVTELVPAPKFYPAEKYHQNYWAKNSGMGGFCKFRIAPKLQQLELLKNFRKLPRL